MNTQFTIAMLIGSISILLSSFTACGASESDVETSITVDTLLPNTVICVDSALFIDTHLTSISDAIIDNSERIVIIDGISCNVLAFSIDGDFLQNISRQGYGPGEFVAPYGMFNTTDGELVVIDPEKQGYLLFDQSFTFIDEFPLWQFSPPLQGTPLSDNEFAAYKLDYDLQGNDIIIKRAIAIYTLGDPEWSRILYLDSIITSTTALDQNSSFYLDETLEPFVLCSDWDERVFFARKKTDEFEVIGWNRQGEEIFYLLHNREPIPKSQSDYIAESTYVAYHDDLLGLNREYQPDLFEPLIANIGIGPDSNLWIECATHDGSVQFDIYDIMSEEHCRTVLLPLSGWSWRTFISTHGILAWEVDPPDRDQKLYVFID